MAPSTASENDVACSSAQTSIAWSRSTSPTSRRTIQARTPTITPVMTRAASATVSARPVAVDGSIRERRNLRDPRWLPRSSPSASVALSAGSACGQRRIARDAPRPADALTTSTRNRTTAMPFHPSCSAREVSPVAFGGKHQADGRDRTLRAETRAPRTHSLGRSGARSIAGADGRGGRLRHHDAPPRDSGPALGQRAPRRGGRPMGRLGQSLVRAAEDPDARRPDRLGVPPRRHVHGDRHRGRRGRDARDRAPLGPDRLPRRCAAHRADDLRDDRVPGRTSASRGPSTRRGAPHLELPVRTHGRLDRPVRGSRAHRHVARPQHPRPGGRVVRGHRPSDRRRSLAVVPRDAPPDRRDRERDRRGGMSGVRAPRDAHRPRGGRARGRDERDATPAGPIPSPSGFRPKHPTSRSRHDVGRRDRPCRQGARRWAARAPEDPGHVRDQRPSLAGGAQEQVRPRWRERAARRGYRPPLRVGRRRNGATCDRRRRRSPRHPRDPARGHRQPVRHQPGAPQGSGGVRADRSPRRSPSARRRQGERRALRGDGRRRARRR